MGCIANGITATLLFIALSSFVYYVIINRQFEFIVFPLAFALVALINWSIQHKVQIHDFMKRQESYPVIKSYYDKLVRSSKVVFFVFITCTGLILVILSARVLGYDYLAKTLTIIYCSGAVFGLVLYLFNLKYPLFIDICKSNVIIRASFLGGCSNAAIWKR